MEFIRENQGENKQVRAKDGENHVGELIIHPQENHWVAAHTNVASEYGGQGIAGQLLDEVMAWAKEENVKIYPECPYVLKKFNDQPEKYEAYDARK